MNSNEYNYNTTYPCNKPIALSEFNVSCACDQQIHNIIQFMKDSQIKLENEMRQKYKFKKQLLKERGITTIPYSQRYQLNTNYNDKNTNFYLFNIPIIVWIIPIVIIVIVFAVWVVWMILKIDSRSQISNSPQLAYYVAQPSVHPSYYIPQS